MDVSLLSSSSVVGLETAVEAEVEEAAVVEEADPADAVEPAAVPDAGGVVAVAVLLCGGKNALLELC